MKSPGPLSTNRSKDVEFRNTARFADAEMSGLILKFQKTQDLAAIEKAWRFKEVETDNGIGFVDSDHNPYSPEKNLFSLTGRIAAIIERDSRYASTDFTIATKIPAYWLECPENDTLESTLSKVTGCTTIHAEMNRDSHPNAKHQSFVVYTVELKSESDAIRLLKMSQNQTSKRFSILGVRQDRVLSLIIARSYVKGVEAVEDRASLIRFEEPFRTALTTKTEL